MKQIIQTINGHLWEINVVPSTDSALYVEGEVCRGTTWFGKQQIFLANDLNVFTAMRVIIHELTHAFLWSTQMRLPESFTEEEVCEFVACWGHQIHEMANVVHNELYCKGDHNGT
jgi:hypothetical protein